MGRRISCPVCGCQKVLGSSCEECGEAYRAPEQNLGPPSGMDLWAAVAIVVLLWGLVVGWLI
jgi:hypothetical protein